MVARVTISVHQGTHPREYLVQVGCQKVVYTDPQAALRIVSRYILDPFTFEKKYLAGRKGARGLSPNLQVNYEPDWT